MSGQNSLENLVPAHLRGLEPYIPSRPDSELMRLYGCEKLYRLNNNENPLGPCPAAARALAAANPDDVKKYPSGDAALLREAVGARLGLDPEQVVVGNGANEVMSFAVRGFCAEGDILVVPDKTFAVCEWLASYNGCVPKLVPIAGNALDLNAMLAAVEPATKIVYVCNPNNPTGGFHKRDALSRFLDRLAGRAVAIVDEAYIEFVEGWESETALPLLEKHENLIVFRTFSKIYALAGLRIGCALCSNSMAQALKRTRIVYSVNALAQAAACASVAPSAETEDHLAASRAMAREGRKLLVSAFDSLKLKHIEGEGNFVMVQLPFNDALAYRLLMKRGYMLRTMTGFRFPNWLRVTCERRPVLEGFCEALAAILKERAA